MCVYVCIYIICIYMYRYYICVYIFISICIYTYMCIYVCVSICILSIYTYMYTHIHLRKLELKWKFFYLLVNDKVRGKQIFLLCYVEKRCF